MLSDDPQLDVVAQAGSAAESREVLEGGSLEGAVDVAVLDLVLPDRDERELIGELGRTRSGILIMVLSATI